MYSSSQDYSADFEEIDDVTELHKIIKKQNNQIQELKNELYRTNKKYVKLLEMNTNLTSSDTEHITNKTKDLAITTGTHQQGFERWTKAKNKWIPIHKQRREQDSIMRQHVTFLKASNQQQEFPKHKRFNNRFNPYKNQANYTQTNNPNHPPTINSNFTQTNNPNPLPTINPNFTVPNAQFNMNPNIFTQPPLNFTTPIFNSLNPNNTTPINNNPVKTTTNLSTFDASKLLFIKNVQNHTQISTPPNISNTINKNTESTEDASMQMQQS